MSEEREVACLEGEEHDFRHHDTYEDDRFKVRVNVYECRLCGARKQQQVFRRPVWARYS